MSPSGAGSDVPALYTCKSRSTPYYSYSANQALYFRSGSDVVPKTFKVILGIGSRLEYPHHVVKLRRRTADRHQYLFYENQYDVLWVELHCTAGEVIENHVGDVQDIPKYQVRSTHRSVSYNLRTRRHAL